MTVSSKTVIGSKSKKLKKMYFCHGKRIGSIEMPHAIPASAMKLDSAILPQTLWCSFEMNKLRFRLNSMYQPCQKKRMFTSCWFFSQHRQLTSLLHTGCEALLIWSRVLLLFFPLHHLMCSSCGHICKHH